MERSESLSDLEVKSKLKSISNKLHISNTTIYYQCIDCGTDLPEFRIKSGMSRCVQCQAEVEKHEKEFRKY